MLSVLITQFVVLWAVIDPIGSVPVYLSQTQHLTAKQRRLVALKAVGISTGVLLFFLIAGQLLLDAMPDSSTCISGSRWLGTLAVRSNNDFW